MKKEDKCISLELAKKINEKLIELKVDVPESEYYWDLDNNAICYGKVQTEYGHDCYEYVPAYDTSELLSMENINIKIERNQNLEFSTSPFFHGYILAEVLAKRYYWLLINGYIKDTK